MTSILGPRSYSRWVATGRFLGTASSRLPTARAGSGVTGHLSQSRDPSDLQQGDGHELSLACRAARILPAVLVGDLGEGAAAVWKPRILNLRGEGSF